MLDTDKYRVQIFVKLVHMQVFGKTALMSRARISYKTKREKYILQSLSVYRPVSVLRVKDSVSNHSVIIYDYLTQKSVIHP